MLKSKQRMLVRNLTKSITDEICEKIDAGKIPEDWDGHELRELLAEKFAFETTSLMKDRKRKKEYRNTVLVNNL